MARSGGSRPPDSDPVSHSPTAKDSALPVPAAPLVRQPIVAILLLISFFTVLSGKPLDALLLATVATALAWDAGLHSRQAAARVTAAPADTPAQVRTEPGAWRLRSRPPRLRLVAIGSTAAVVYALTVGSFTRYSWPATAGVVGLGATVVVVGWGGPTRQRQIPAKFTRIGAFTWGTLFIIASLWELAALLMQPSIETSSYAHPTISTLTDPLLASAPGRTIALLGWIALGAYLVER